MRLKIIHRLAPLLVALFAGCREMPHDQYVALLTEAHDTMVARQERLNFRFHLDAYEHWDWSQDAGVLVFSDSGVAKVVADVQFVGDVSRRDSTFLCPGPDATWVMIGPSGGAIPRAERREARESRSTLPRRRAARLLPPGQSVKSGPLSSSSGPGHDHSDQAAMCVDARPSKN